MLKLAVYQLLPLRQAHPIHSQGAVTLSLPQRIFGKLLPHRFAVEASAGAEMMTAAFYLEHGNADVLQVAPVPRPIPKSNQLLIRIDAAGLNPVDCKLRLHQIPSFVVPLPKIPGTDFAGEVVTAARNGNLQPGDRVFGMLPLLGLSWGACAQYVAIEERFVSRAPANIDALGAASLPLVALTVTQALHAAIDAWRGKTDGKRALIQAGTGGVGSFAIQYCANILGMEVATTASPRHFSWVRDLGATTVVDYHTERFEEKIQGYDLVLDPLGHRYEQRTLASAVLRKGGHYLRIAASDWDSATIGWTIPEATPAAILAGVSKSAWHNSRARLGMGGSFYHLVFVHPDGAGLAEIARYVDTGRIRPVVDRVYALEEIRKAHLEQQAGHVRGKLVLMIS